MILLQKILRRRSHYREVFRKSKSADVVLADLKRFCRGMSSPCVVSQVSGNVDPIATGIAIGRQEVWMRIVTHLDLDDSQLLKFKEEADNE